MVFTRGQEKEKAAQMAARPQTCNLVASTGTANILARGLPATTRRRTNQAAPSQNPTTAQAIGTDGQPKRGPGRPRKNPLSARNLDDDGQPRAKVPENAIPRRGARLAVGVSISPPTQPAPDPPSAPLPVILRRPIEDPAEVTPRLLQRRTISWGEAEFKRYQAPWIKTFDDEVVPGRKLERRDDTDWDPEFHGYLFDPDTNRNTEHNAWLPDDVAGEAAQLRLRDIPLSPPAWRPVVEEQQPCLIARAVVDDAELDDAPVVCEEGTVWLVLAIVVSLFMIFLGFFKGSTARGRAPNEVRGLDPEAKDRAPDTGAG